MCDTVRVAPFETEVSSTTLLGEGTSAAGESTEGAGESDGGGSAEVGGGSTVGSDGTGSSVTVAEGGSTTGSEGRSTDEDEGVSRVAVSSRRDTSESETETDDGSSVGSTTLDVVSVGVGGGSTTDIELPDELAESVVEEELD